MKPTGETPEAESTEISITLFEAVNPELLRATAPLPAGARAPLKSEDSEESELVLEKIPRPNAGAPFENDLFGGSGKSPPLVAETGKKRDPYGIEQGKESCLRSVLQRLKSGKMSAIEEARAMQFLVENEVVRNQAELASAMARPKSKVSEKLSLLKLPRSVQLMMERHGDILTEGHAIELMRLKDAALILSVASRILEQNLSRDRLRREISFLLEKHGGDADAGLPGSPRRVTRVSTSQKYFDRPGGAFDWVIRFRPASSRPEIENLIKALESKAQELRTLLRVEPVESASPSSTDSPRESSPEMPIGEILATAITARH